MTLQWRETDASSPRSAGFARRRLDRSSAESEAMEAASRLQLIAVSCSAIPTYISWAKAFAIKALRKAKFSNAGVRGSFRNRARVITYHLLS
ncbi:hypothetical protein HUG20_14050 [Salicibibacter cibi]|uniref:Uncharacterized protein n=1 Tax=Salicibibacter cibi TaxID=2743001 RepID=A0A7T6ZCC2_9BACI|nr:hypothetical protein [Salicibibacter cibi]QQK80903.1 hypothetical protein HUG20_14050 [Salicibibacter cibi]